MAYHKTIFRQLLQLTSRLEFQSLVERYNGDYRIRSTRCWDQFIHLMFTQLGARHSLRDLVAGAASFAHKFYHLGCRQVSRSTLSDANSKRPHQIYKDLFFVLLLRTQKIAPHHKLKLSRKLFYMDSTTIDLCLKLYPWARFRKAKAAVKLHTLLQADGGLPVFLIITEGKTSDMTAARMMKVPKGSFLVIDRGYHDFRQYKFYTDNDIRFVTRAKTNSKYEVVRSLSVDRSTGVLSDELIRFTVVNTAKKYPGHLRKISYRDQETKKEFVFLTNDFGLDAKTVADIYKARWEIEIFFKTIKQNLKIKRFIGNSINAVMTQIWIAMIAYLLISYHKFAQKSKYSIQQLFRLIQINLFERKSLTDLVKDKPVRPPNLADSAQLALLRF